MESQFGNFSAFDPSDRTTWYEFPIELPGNPRLKLKHAGRSNRAYTQAIIDANAKGGQKRRAQTIDALDDGLNLDRRLFPKHVIVGWDRVQDSEGKPIPYGANVCLEFLKALPDWLVQDVSIFAAKPENFLAEDSPSDVEVEEQAGN